MNNLENNKIFAAILVAGIVAMLCGFVARTLVAPEHMEQDAVSVEAAAGPVSGGGAAVAAPEPILALLATADTAKGEKVHKVCTACHSFDKGGADGVGPNLWNIVGNKKHHIAGFAYSGELIKVGNGTWTYDDLNHFLWKPKDYAPGTKMSFIGVKKPEDRAALIAWLRTLSDSPAALPSQADIDKEAAAAAPPKTEENVDDKTGDKPDAQVDSQKADAKADADLKKEAAPTPSSTPQKLIPQPVKKSP